MRKLVAAIALATALQGCSYGYDVIATVVDGRLAFVSANDDFTCIANIFVTAEDGTRAAAAPQDEVGLVANGGAFWWTDAPVIDCTMNFPVFYGSFPGELRHDVLPKPLKVGAVYAVSTEGEGANGNGCFRITPERRVENLPYHQCHPAPPPAAARSTKRTFAFHRMQTPSRSSNMDPLRT